MLKCGLCCKSTHPASLNVKQHAPSSHRAIDRVSSRPLDKHLEVLRQQQRARARHRSTRPKEAHPLPRERGLDPAVLAVAAAALRRREANRALQQSALEALHALTPGTDCPEISRVLRRTNQHQKRPGTSHGMASTASLHLSRPAIPPRHPGRLKQPRTSKTRGAVVVKTATSTRRARPLSRPRSQTSHQYSPPIRLGDRATPTRPRSKTVNSPHPPGHCSHCGSVEPGVAAPGAARAKLWDAVRRSLSQQSQVSSVVSPLEALSISSAGPPLPSRTSSQQRALDQFVKQLETYADRRGVAGQVPVFTPTPESVLSYHTVSALLPYEADVLKAGLAVTSSQQARKPPMDHSPGTLTPEALGLDGHLAGKPLPRLPKGTSKADLHVAKSGQACAHQQNTGSDQTEVVFAADNQRWDSA